MYNINPAQFFTVYGKKGCMPSSVIATTHFDAVTATLRVIFLSGMTYDYINVPEKIYKAMKTATSKGKYLNTYIKGHYDFKKIK